MKMRPLSEEIERLRQVKESTLQINLKVLQDEVIRLTDIKEKNEKYITELTNHRCQEGDLQKRVSEHMALFVILFAEIESLRHRLVSK
jgi:hypothetical protein